MVCPASPQDAVEDVLGPSPLCVLLPRVEGSGGCGVGAAVRRETGSTGLLIIVLGRWQEVGL